MQLYGLKQLRVVREEKLDTKCFLAWNEDILVLAFRGTASTRNAISDLQVCFLSTMLQFFNLPHWSAVCRSVSGACKSAGILPGTSAMLMWNVHQVCRQQPARSCSSSLPHGSRTLH